MMDRTSSKTGRSRKRYLLRAIIPLATVMLLCLILVATAGGSGVFTLVSSDSQGNVYTTNSQIESSLYPVISADGRYVAFQSSFNLTPDDTINAYDIYVKDLATGETTLVSTDSAGVQTGPHSKWPSISADGRYVSFTSAARLVYDDTDTNDDVYVKDMVTGQTERASTITAGLYAEWNYASSISGDGRLVAFVSSAYQNVPGDTNNALDIYIKDMITGTTTRASIDSAGSQFITNCEDPFISADGSLVAFQCYGTSYFKNIQTGALSSISGFNPVISADNRFAAFSSSSNLVAADIDNQPDVYVKDLTTGETTLASPDSAGIDVYGEDWSSGSPAISGDGRYVAFSSDSTKLVPNDGLYGCLTSTTPIGDVITECPTDVFFHDRLTGQITRLSVNSEEPYGNVNSETPTMSADGALVAFSTRGEFIPQDANYYADIYAVTTPAADACASGQPSLSLSKSRAYWGSYADFLARSLSVDYNIGNSGSQAASNVQVQGSTATNGVTCSTAMPAPAIAIITGGSSGTVTLQYNVPAGVNSFRTSAYVTAIDGCLNSYWYPGPMPGV